MDASDLARLIATAEQLSPERYPDQAIALNQRIVQLDPSSAAAYVRLARGYQARRDFAAAVAACQDALRHDPQSAAAQRRLQRVSEEWEFARRAQTIASYDEALRRGVAQKDEERLGEAIACLWRAADLSTNPRQTIRSHNALAAAYRFRKDPGSLDRAAALYEWVLRQAPGNPAARRGLATVLREQREMSRGQWEHTWRRADTRARAERERRRQEGQRQQRAGQRKSHHLTKKPANLAEAFEILNLRPPATRDDIRRAYRTQARVAHPDRGGSHAAMVRLNAAYELALASVSGLRV